MRSRVRLFPMVSIFSAVAVGSFTTAPLDSATAAYTFKRIHSFCSRVIGDYCVDGSQPVSRFVMDQSGNLYGTTTWGGKYNGGAVFRFTPNADKTRYTETTLHSFCANYVGGCPDGYLPYAGVILDVDGNIYGTTYWGGTGFYNGVVFKLTHTSKGWKASVLKNFCEDEKCTDGSTPTTGLSYAGQDSGKPWDESSPLFGTTGFGGTYNNGVVFELASNGNYSVIHNFQNSSDPNEVLVDSAGNIYGTSLGGGKYGGGLMYKLASGSWSETTLHNFCNTQNCADGSGPVGRLAMDASGDLFGVTGAGGSNSNDVCGYGTCGVVFERSAGGSYSVLYNFCSRENCTDGANPDGAVSIDSSGNLFGTAANAGANGQGGAVYELPAARNTCSIHSAVNRIAPTARRQMASSSIRPADSLARPLGAERRMLARSSGWGLKGTSVQRRSHEHPRVIRRETMLTTTKTAAAAMTFYVLFASQSAFAAAQPPATPHRAATTTVSCKKPVEEVLASDASSQTTSMYWDNLTDGLVTFNSRRAGCVIVTVSGDVTAPNEFMFVRAFLDGQTACTPSDNLNNAIFASETGTVQESRTMTYLCAGVPAGAHSIQIQYESEVGGQVTFYGHTIVVGHN